MPRRVLSERQTGGPEVANSHAPQARGPGYGAAGPMFDSCATRAFRFRALLCVQLDLFEAVGDADPRAQAKRAGGAARSAA